MHSNSKIDLAKPDGKELFESRSLSEAGRMLFTVSRQAKAKANDADRLRKYLARFGLTWERARGSALG
jgi:transcriptional regulatory protein RtcR